MRVPLAFSQNSMRVDKAHTYTKIEDKSRYKAGVHRDTRIVLHNRSKSALKAFRHSSRALGRNLPAIPHASPPGSGFIIFRRE